MPQLLPLHMFWVSIEQRAALTVHIVDTLRPYLYLAFISSIRWCGIVAMGSQGRCLWDGNLDFYGTSSSSLPLFVRPWCQNQTCQVLWFSLVFAHGSFSLWNLSSCLGVELPPQTALALPVFDGACTDVTIANFSSGGLQVIIVL